MNIKRTSYFTFLVVITTLTTVSSYGTTKAGQTIPPEPVSAVICPNELYLLCLEGLSQMDERFIAAQAFSEKKTGTRKFKIVINQNGTVSIFLVFDKNYKGQVSTGVIAAPVYADNLLPAKMAQPISVTAPLSFLINKKEEILHKNCTLLI